MSNPHPHPLPTTTYPIEKLLQLWRNGEMTETQAIGHLLQHVAWLEGQGAAPPKAGQRLPQPDK